MRHVCCSKQMSIMDPTLSVYYRNIHINSPRQREKIMVEMNRAEEGHVKLHVFGCHLQTQI